MRMIRFLLAIMSYTIPQDKAKSVLSTTKFYFGIVIVIAVIFLFRYDLSNHGHSRARASHTTVAVQEHLRETTNVYKQHKLISLEKVRKYRQPKCNSEQLFKTNMNLSRLMERVASSPRGLCQCGGLQRTPEFEGAYVESMCSDEATLLGKDQKVVAYSLYTKNQTDASWEVFKYRFFDGVRENLRFMKKYYPGWVMRVYSNLSYTDDVCETVCSDDDLYFCNVHELPGYENVQNIHPMTWRFIPLGDPTVKVFLSRDLDSRLSRREKAAVDQWDETGFPIHGMRDHPQHGTHIMGGMWGADNSKLCPTTAWQIQLHIMSPQWKLLGLDDQQILSSAIYSRYKRKIFTHDSYLCEYYKDSVPFPTQRTDNFFVGGVLLDDETKNYDVNVTLMGRECPLACRPKDGQDWKYC